MIIVGVCLCLAIGVQAQLNPLGRFGQCIDITPLERPNEDMEGTWYLQYRPKNPDYGVHTGQAQYMEFVGDDLRSLLYFYNKNVMVNAPQDIKYHPSTAAGRFRRAITVDDYAANIYLNVLGYDPVLNYRIDYLCTDNEHANPAIFNVAISTREIRPENIKQIYDKASNELFNIRPQFKVELMKVNQEGIAELNVKKKTKPKQD